MTEILEYVHEKLDRAAGRILELLTGLGYKLREVQVRAPDVRREIGARQARHSPPSGPSCDRY
ncbi:MAG: hypothetical protein ABSE08_16460 [Syntrophobacteraceae bacterium]